MSPLARFSSLLLAWLTILPTGRAFALGDECLGGVAQIQFSPSRFGPGDEVQIKAIAIEDPIDRVTLESGGLSKDLPSRLREGPPRSLTTQFLLAETGTSPPVIRIYGEGQELGCLRLRPAALTDQPKDWSPDTEAYYAAWIEQLFDAPVDQDLSFRSLEPVLRDPDRNFLMNHFGRGEDNRLPATPDCADLPYFLRSYFAWKIGLPIGYRACDRGSSLRPPRCGPSSIDDRFTRGEASAAEFSQFTRKLNDTVHSGSARTDLLDESTDFYPVGLDRKSLWPGTVFADPYGHTLILAKWIAPEKGKPGVLLAADAQPDNSVTRKRFWEGNFLFADIPGAGSGFKAFRPIRLEGSRYVLPSNSELRNGAGSTPYSDRQRHLDPESFYADMTRAINPQGLDPVSAYEDKLAALIEQVATRDTAVQNAERYQKQHPGSVIAMPQGTAIFQTTGPWEDYASPSRDMRLLIALKTIEHLPDQIRLHPELFKVNDRDLESERSKLLVIHQQHLTETIFRYTQSDGQSFSLPLKTLFERREALEIAYNPNDCPEIRWGATPGTEEFDPCRRQAPAEQKSRMEQYRSWFRNTQRPSR